MKEVVEEKPANDSFLFPRFSGLGVQNPIDHQAAKGRALLRHPKRRKKIALGNVPHEKLPTSLGQAAGCQDASALSLD
jgi:hypothetical protein